MRKRALWIFDENFLMLTYISVCSFIEHCDAIITLVVCDKRLKEKDEELFLALDATVEILYFDADVSRWESHFQANILNRLARIHYTRLFQDDLLFMIDADVSFSAGLGNDLHEIESQYSNNTGPKPMISGVVEFLNATDAYLYFKKKDADDHTRKTTETAKVEAYQNVYGSNWKSIVNGFQFNNGFLLFYKAKPLIDQWEQYYLAGLDEEEINPLDDQVPLSAAIKKTECPYWTMPPKWNSLGDLDGTFNMFHAWGGEWKIEIDQVLRNQNATSDYGRICKQYTSNLPAEWIVKFNKDLASIPYRYRHISGAFDHGTLFSDLIAQLPHGKVVEVGTYLGRSACFVAELIKASKKNITFHTIDNYQRNDHSLELVQQNLGKAGMSDYVSAIEAHSLDAAERYENEALDFVFLDTDSPPSSLSKELNIWYTKLKKGGIIAGYDHSIHDTVYKTYECATDAFCKKNKLPLRTYEYQFIIQKPIHSKN